LLFTGIERPGNFFIRSSSARLYIYQKLKIMAAEDRIFKNYRRIIFILMLIILQFTVSVAQDVSVKKDSLVVKQEKESMVNNEKKAENTSKNMAIKQVRSGNPDLSRARGARPQSVVRPAGSAIPKGIGRPGGAKPMGRP
jgi:hypothetical protein